MKKELIVLHGALGSTRQFQALIEQLKHTFTVYAFNFEGHGGRPIQRPFSIELFTQNLIDFCVKNELNAPLIFGYSMGGYVALNASANGLLIDKVITLGTKFEWTPEDAAQEIKQLNPELIEQKVPKFAQHQQHLHAPEDWKIVMNETANMMLRLGNEPVLTDDKLTQIETQLICCLGTEDTMVTADESLHVVKLVPGAAFHSIEGFVHPIEKVDVETLAEKIVSFSH